MEGGFLVHKMFLFYKRKLQLYEVFIIAFLSLSICDVMALYTAFIRNKIERDILYSHKIGIEG